MAANKIVINTENGEKVLIDLTNDTVTPETLAEGVVAHDASGQQIIGLAPTVETDPTVPAWAKASTKPSYTKSEVGLGNVDNVKQYSASNPPPYPVTKVNNKTGEVTLSASDVGADASGTASSAISSHNSNSSAHGDIRSAIETKADKSEGTFYVEGSGTTDSTAKTSTWVGSSDRITEYYDGLAIRYKIGVAGQTTTTLNINGLGAKPIYLFNTTKLTTQFPVNSIINLIYHASLNSGCWMCSDYDSNTNTYQRVYPSTDNVEYPVTARYNTTTGSSYYAEYGRYSTGVTLNPSTNTITATKFKGALTGNADTATKATQDANGKVIASTYETKTDASAKITSHNSDASAHADIRQQISQLSSEKVDVLSERVGTLENEIVKLSQVSPPEIVDSIDEMTDTTKQYVLDGYIYQYKKVPGSLVPNFTNLFSKDKVHIHKRYAATKLTDFASQTGSVSESSFTGHFTVHQIPINFSDLSKEYVIRIANFPTSIKVSTNTIVPITPTRIETDYNLQLTINKTTHATVDASNLNLQTITLPTTSHWHTVTRLQSNIKTFGIVLKLSSSAITLDDVPDDLIITVNEPIEYVQGEAQSAWVNTGLSYSPTDYEDRILELESQTAKMKTDISSMKSAYLRANLLKGNIVRSINHRGYNTIAPENTLPAYKLSKEAGFDYVECDISITKDGKFVLLHNDTIDATSNGSGAIAGMNLSEVRAYDFGSWKSTKYAGTVIPTLEEFLNLCRNVGLKAYLEIKNGTWTQAVVNECVSIVKKYGMQKNVTWIAFGSTALQYIANADSKARLGLLGSSLSSSLITSAVSLKTDNNEVFVSVQNADSTIDDALITQCVNNDIGLEVWNVNTTSGIVALHPYVSGVTADELMAGNVLYDTSMGT